MNVKYKLFTTPTRCSDRVRCLTMLSGTKLVNSWHSEVVGLSSIQVGHLEKCLSTVVGDDGPGLSLSVPLLHNVVCDVIAAINQRSIPVDGSTVFGRFLYHQVDWWSRSIWRHTATLKKTLSYSQNIWELNGLLIIIIIITDNFHSTCDKCHEGKHNKIKIIHND